jgi:hypothetical protein
MDIQLQTHYEVSKWLLNKVAQLPLEKHYIIQPTWFVVDVLNSGKKYSMSMP